MTAMVCLFPLVAWSQDAHVVGHISDENNQFQRDLDKGQDRDASYIYGPAQPRTWFAGINLKL